jgi:hypothetical protein
MRMMAGLWVMTNSAGGTRLDSTVPPDRTVCRGLRQVPLISPFASRKGFRRAADARRP